MAELGSQRRPKKCKEKFENVYKYHKRTKDGRATKSDGKTYLFFDQLEAFEAAAPPPSFTPPPSPPAVLLSSAPPTEQCDSFLDGQPEPGERGTPGPQLDQTVEFPVSAAEANAAANPPQAAAPYHAFETHNFPSESFLSNSTTSTSSTEIRVRALRFNLGKKK